VFPKLNENKTDSNYISSRAILSTKNDCVDRINVKMINKFQGVASACLEAEEELFHHIAAEHRSCKWTL
jgi:hypothetical protein